MANESPTAGYYELRSVFMKNYDGSKDIELTRVVYNFRLVEGIDEGVIRAQISIVDSSNLIDAFPIRGEEFISITLADFYDVEKTYEFHVYSISPVKVDRSSSKQDYTLFLYSKDFVKTESTEIRRSYEDALSRTALTIYEEYFTGEKPLDLQPTDGTVPIVIPAMTPYEAMNMLAKKSYAQSTPSSIFKFFETRDDYKFITLEELISRVDRGSIPQEKIYTYEDPKLSESSPEVAMQNMISYTPFSRFNLMNEMRQGGMINGITRLDLSKKTIEEITYKHYENLDQYASTDGERRRYHSENFQRDFFGEDNILTRYIVFDDTTKPESYYDEILPKRISNNYYLSSISIGIEVYGSFKLNVGDLIEIKMPNPVVDTTGVTEEHDSISGYYLVNRMEHNLQEQTWTTNIILIKDALRSENL